MIALLASIAALSIGPLLHRLALRKRSVLPVLDGFTFVAISGLVLLHVLVQSFHAAGAPALLLLLVGLAGPTLGERLLHRAAHHVHRAALTLAMVGLALHAALDGMALARAGSDHGAELALAVILHRVPVSLAIWVLLRPPYGVAAALGVLTLTAASTVAGYALGVPLVGSEMGPGVGLFQALVAGSLMHVVMHRSPLHTGQSAWRVGVGLGGLLAAGLLVALHLVHGHEGHASVWAEVLAFGLPVALVVVALVLPRRAHKH